MSQWWGKENMKYFKLPYVRSCRSGNLTKDIVELQNETLGGPYSDPVKVVIKLSCVLLLFCLLIYMGKVQETVFMHLLFLQGA